MAPFQALCAGIDQCPTLALAIAAIGVGSFLFHTFANGLTRLLDVLPILIFQLLFLWFYARQKLALNRRQSALLLTVFMVAALLGCQFPQVLNGSLIYAPALLAVFLLGIHHMVTASTLRYHLLAATAVLTVSLFFRTIDDAVCLWLPFGTHFLWHLGNSLAVFLAASAISHRQH